MKYTYNLNTDFLNQKIHLSSLIKSIRDSAITKAINYIDYSTDGYLVDIYFKESLVTTICNNHTGQALEDPYTENGIPVFSLPKRQSDNTPEVAISTRVGKEAIYSTHNFCDPCTWYGESERVFQQELTSSDGYKWDSPDHCWIDLNHGRLMDEEGLKDDQKVFNPSDPHGYEIVVEASHDDGYTWESLSQHSPFKNLDNDFAANYLDGYIVTLNNYSNARLRASYSKKNGPGWLFRPLPDTSVAIEKAEIQFSADCVYTNTIIIETFGTVDFFAPQLLIENGGFLPSGTSIPINTTYYKTLHQIIDESIGFFPKFPALGGPERGTLVDTYILQFHYGTAKVLYDSLGMFIKISLRDNVSFGGSRTTATFYFLSKKDPGPESALKVLL